MDRKASASVPSQSSAPSDCPRLTSGHSSASSATSTQSSQSQSRKVDFGPLFHCCYLLVSENVKKGFKGRTYIGYTVNPARRIQQHNGGRGAGGAKRTEDRGPWVMVLLVHGFICDNMALRFEWAWQQPQKSRRLKDRQLKKGRTESQLKFRLRVLSALLNTTPWSRLCLNVHWLSQPHFASDAFAADAQPPVHMAVSRGTFADLDCAPPFSALISASGPWRCFVCASDVTQRAALCQCPLADCAATFHLACLADEALSSGAVDKPLVPTLVQCASCRATLPWADVVRRRVHLLDFLQISGQ